MGTIGGATGPWGISAQGDMSLAGTVQKFVGIQFYVVDPNGNKIYGTTSEPKGDPTPGGAAVPWGGGGITGLMSKGTYTVTIAMTCIDGTGTQRTMTATQNQTLPP